MHTVDAVHGLIAAAFATNILSAICKSARGRPSLLLALKLLQLGNAAVLRDARVKFVLQFMITSCSIDSWAGIYSFRFLLLAVLNRGIVMSANRFAVTGLLCFVLAGCGTYVPDIQEFPGDSADGQRLVAAIVRNVKCEVRDALDDLYRLDRHPFLDAWGVQITLNLTMVEKGTLNPAGVWMPVSPLTSVFTLGADATLSSEATRTEKLSSYYTVRQLRKLGRCVPEARGGPFLLQSNLKLNEWLINAATAGNTGGVDFPAAADAFKDDGVLSHEVKFDVTTAGGITPAWKLVTGTINQTGTFLAASRDRSHDLIITFGPTADPPKSGPNKGKAGPSRIAADAALASDIGVSVGNSIKRALRP